MANLITNLFSSISGQDKEKNKLYNIDSELMDIIKNSIDSTGSIGSEKVLTDILSDFTASSFIQGSKKRTPKNNTVDHILKTFNVNVSDNNSRKDLYNSYKFLVKNIPQLDNALETITENILTPDEIFKEILRITPRYDLKHERSTSFIDNVDIEANNLNSIIKALAIDEKLFNWVSNSLLLGCTFIEIVETKKITQEFLAEDSSAIVSTNINLNNKIEKEHKKRLDDTIKSMMLEESVLFETIVKDENRSHNIKKITESQFVESLITEDVISFDDTCDLSFVDTNSIIIENATNLNSDKDFKDNVFNSLSSFKKKKKTSDKETIKKMKDANNDEKLASLSSLLLITHESERIIKLTASNVTIGYLVISENPMSTQLENRVFGSVGNIINFNNDQLQKTNQKMADFILKQVTDKIKSLKNISSKKSLDLDMSELEKIASYMILEKKTINVRFVDSMHMMEFINKPKFGTYTYGQSVLDPALFLSKYYIALLISYTIFNITRAPEKRIFKVEAGVSDSDLSNSIQHVASKIKQREQSFRNFDKLDGMTRELTQYDDIFIPAKDGQTGFSVESLPGQQSNIDMSLMSDILRQIINSTKVPPTLLGDNENSYHTSASQESYKFSKHISRRQADVSMDLTKNLSKIYFLIHGIPLEHNQIKFNPPIFAKIEQVATMVGQVQALCDFVANAYGQDDNGQDKIDRLEICKMFVKFVDWDILDRLAKDKQQALMLKNEIQKLKPTDPGIDNQINQDPTLQQNQPQVPQQ